MNGPVPVPYTSADKVKTCRGSRLKGRARVLDAVLRLLSHLSLRQLHVLANLIAFLSRVIKTREANVAMTNVNLCFPGWSQKDRHSLARQAMRENAKGIAEIAALWYWPRQKVLKLVRSVDGEAVLEQALAEGKGLLVLAPHQGAWEILQMWLAQKVSLNALYRPPRWPELEALLNKGRSRSGAKFWPAKPSGVRALLKALKAGETVGVLPDQSPPGEGVYAPFFGQPAKTMTLFSKLAARTGAPVIVGWAERLPSAQGYKLHWYRATESLADADSNIAAKALNQEIESVVMQCPEQYQWTYRRFLKRPAGLSNPYE